MVEVFVPVSKSLFCLPHTLPPSPLPLPLPLPLPQNLLGIKNVRRDFHYAIYDLCRNIAETK